MCKIGSTETGNGNSADQDNPVSLAASNNLENYSQELVDPTSAPSLEVSAMHKFLEDIQNYLQPE